MASFIGDRVYDNGLTTLDTEANRIDICSALPTTYTAATSTYSLGSASGANFPGIGSPAAGSPDGRQVTVSAVTNGSVSATGTATHYAIVDTVNSRLLAAGALSASQAVTNGNSFTLTSAVIRFPAPA
jgi:hypothetical protein